MRLKLLENQLRKIRENYNYIPSYNKEDEHFGKMAYTPFSTISVLSYLPDENTDELDSFKEEFFNEIVEYNYMDISQVLGKYVMVFNLMYDELYDLMLKFGQEKSLYASVEVSDGTVESECGLIEAEEPYLRWSFLHDDGNFRENFISPFINEKDCREYVANDPQLKKVQYKGFEFFLRPII